MVQASLVLEGQDRIWLSFLHLCPPLQVSLKLIGRVNKHARQFPSHSGKQIMCPSDLLWLCFSAYSLTCLCQLAFSTSSSSLLKVSTFPLFIVLVKDNLKLESHIPSHFRVNANFIFFCTEVSFPLEIPCLRSQPPLPSPKPASLISVCTALFPDFSTLIFPPKYLTQRKHTLACGSPSFTPLLREMSVSGDCKVTFRKEAYSWLSINQDKTEKITPCAALLLGTCIYALGIKRVSPTQPRIHVDAFCLATSSSLPGGTVVNSPDYLKQ